jgi:hypothetical protein
MRRALRLLNTFGAGCLLTVAFATACATKAPPRPGSELDTVVEKFKPLDPLLLVDCTIATGPLSAVIDVARQRKEALEECNRRWAKVRALQPIDED